MLARQFLLCNMADRAASSSSSATAAGADAVGTAVAAAPPPPLSPPPPLHPQAVGKSCAQCGGLLYGRWKRCGGCKSVFYCSAEHAVAHGEAHREACQAEQARIEAAACAGGLVLGADTEAARRAASVSAPSVRPPAQAAASMRACSAWHASRCASQCA